MGSMLRDVWGDECHREEPSRSLGSVGARSHSQLLEVGEACRDGVQEGAWVNRSLEAGPCQVRRWQCHSDCQAVKGTQGNRAGRVCWTPGGCP